ncbi:ketoacyl-ACP synthase III [Carboxylicivirga sp. A043]|uniref:ketoacyl-ACP synthase III n=1 Tax=Carboxylicivirga litoralis TaxID=2816963 RepID=UPI0021CB440D|nr:ketoacyl-ACP synthase III [Carboxylicivirga sp. A043]MCU4157537.1 ketoacyl-ACP synthase III [Carboxylicivirga sp. A043]
MLGIQNIGTYLPIDTVSNYDLKEKFEMDDFFIQNKIGVESVTRKSDDEDSSDLGVKAYRNLQEKAGFASEELECLVVVTQNPDHNIPHTSAMIHGKLDLPESCASFDVSLGCSGFVYGLSVITAFMTQNGMKKGVLITADPYSKVLDTEDKNTSLLFGDGATATLISDTPIFTSERFTFGTSGKGYEGLICRNGQLFMSGHAIFNFAAKIVPKDVKKLLEQCNHSTDSVDRFVFHQGSKYIVDTLRKRLRIAEEKVPFKINAYGNTVSSSIPFILADMLEDTSINTCLISGFGVGLSWSSALLKRL